jgi:hypothetical protein
MRLAHAARDQLGDLGAEVEDEDLVVHGLGIRTEPGAGVPGARRLAAEMQRPAAGPGLQRAQK